MWHDGLDCLKDEKRKECLQKIAYVRSHVAMVQKLNTFFYACATYGSDYSRWERDCDTINEAFAPEGFASLIQPISKLYEVGDVIECDIRMTRLRERERELREQCGRISWSEKRYIKKLISAHKKSMRSQSSTLKEATRYWKSLTY